MPMSTCRVELTLGLSFESDWIAGFHFMSAGLNVCEFILLYVKYTLTSHAHITIPYIINTLHIV